LKKRRVSFLPRYFVCSSSPSDVFLSPPLHQRTVVTPPPLFSFLGAPSCKHGLAQRKSFPFLFPAITERRLLEKCDFPPPSLRFSFRYKTNDFPPHKQAVTCCILFLFRFLPPPPDSFFCFVGTLFPFGQSLGCPLETCPFFPVYGRQEWTPTLGPGAGIFFFSPSLCVYLFFLR